MLRACLDACSRGPHGEATRGERRAAPRTSLNVGNTSVYTTNICASTVKFVRQRYTCISTGYFPLKMVTLHSVGQVLYIQNVPQARLETPIEHHQENCNTSQGCHIRLCVCLDKFRLWLVLSLTSFVLLRSRHSKAYAKIQGRQFFFLHFQSMCQSLDG